MAQIVDFEKFSATKSAGYTFVRSNPIPVDKTSYFATLTAATEYASSDPVAYVGQVISVLQGTQVEVYKIASGGTLELVGRVGAVTAATYSAALELAEAKNIGQILYVTGDETTGGTTYTAGPYMVTGDGTVIKMSTSTPSGHIEEDVQKLLISAHTHANKEVLDTITSGKTQAWDNAEQNAKDFATAHTKTAIEALDATKSGASHNVTVTVAEEDGKITGVTVEAPDFATLYAGKAYEAKVDTNTSAITVLNGTTAQTGSVKEQVKTAIDTEVTNRNTAITNAINELDATVSAQTNGTKVTIVEEDGKLKSVAVVAPDVDAKIAAETARTEAAYSKTGHTHTHTAITDWDAIIGTAFTSTNSVEKAITDNEKVTTSAIIFLKETKSDTGHTHTHTAITDFDDAVKAIKTNSAVTAENLTGNITTGQVTNLETFVQGKIDTTVSGLDADITSTESNGTKVQVVETDGKITAVNVTAATAAVYSMVKDTSTSETYSAVYHLTKDGVNVGDPINIAKDMMIEAAGLVEYDGSATTITIGETTYTVQGTHSKGKYVVMIIANKASDNQIWINVQDLIDVYTAGNGITITNNTISAKVAATGNEFLKIDANGLAVTGVSNAIEVAKQAAITTASGNTTDAIDALGATVSGTNNGVTVTVTESKGKITVVDVVAPNVDSKIDTKIQTLDATVSAETNGTKVTVTETDGKLTDIAVVAPDVDAKINTAISGLDADITSTEVNGVQVEVKEVDGKITEVIVNKAPDVDTKITTAINALDAVKSGESTYVEVEVGEADGKLTAVTVTDKAALTTAVANANSAVQKVNEKTGTAITIEAKDVALGEAVSGQAATAKVSAVLSNIYDVLAGKVASVQAASGETAVVVDNTTATAPKVSLKLSAETGNALEKKTDGLFAAIYYETEA